MYSEFADQAVVCGEIELISELFKITEGSYHYYTTQLQR
jgi:hypothetical protein